MAGSGGGCKTEISYHLIELYRDVLKNGYKIEKFYYSTLAPGRIIVVAKTPGAAARRKYILYPADRRDYD